MKALIVYESIHHGNTQKIVDMMAKVLKAKIMKSAEADPSDISAYDMIGFGSGIYMWKHHRNLFKLVESLPQVKGKKAFIFSTHGAKLIGNYHAPLKKKLEEKGFRIVDEFACPGWDTFGPLVLTGGLNKGRPNEIDLAAAKEFAKKLNAI